MRKSWGKAADGGAKVGISAGFLHSVVFTCLEAVAKAGVYAQVFRQVCSGLFTALGRVFDLLGAGFSTQSPGLITKTTNSINK